MQLKEASLSGKTAVAAAHDAVAAKIRPGDTAIDATVGNGHDTAVLARLVGANGYVYGFDIQASALESARHKLETEGLAHRVRLFKAGHECIASQLPARRREKIRAAMFNLGYLPGGDKRRTTQPGTTCSALTQAKDWLASPGVITVVLYTGHPGGLEEKKSVLQWADSLGDPCWKAVCYVEDDRKDAPLLLVFSRD